MNARDGTYLGPLVLCAVAALWDTPADAQMAIAAPASGQTVVVQTPGGPPQVITVDGPVPPGVKPEPSPEDESEEKKGGKKEGDAKESPPGEKKADKKDDKPAVVKRPATPPAAADPTELDIRPDAAGRVRFNFRGQAWPDVLDWLATVSNMSLDWQELPGDYLNLVTQRSYTVDEARDLINRHLLARGYTLLVVNEVLTAAKTENINAALVPRVEPEQLASRLPHEYVKVSFPLDWMMAETAVEELKPMLSPNGKLTALKTTNRLEALDSVANLRELHEVLTREQSTTSQERLVKEFVLEYARATDVSEQLRGLLGIDSKSRGPQMPMSPQQMEMMQQQQQMMMQMQQEQQQRGGKPGPTGPKAQGDVNLVVNARRNSILVNAPPDKMAVIAKAVEVIDVPLDRDQSLLLNVNRMQVYRLAALDPETLIRTLQESGDLDPTTRLEADRKNNAIIAYAPLTDQMTIRTLVEKLDGSGRQFEVIRLKRLQADYVAGTIMFMMGQEEKKEEERPRYYGFWDGGDRRSSEDQKQGKFRVDADIEGNRLLLWANDIEMEEVHNLLVKLGEVPAAGANSERMRVLDVDVGDGTEQLLEQIRRVWPTLAPNPIQLPPPEALPKPVGTKAESGNSRSEPAPAPPGDPPGKPPVEPKSPSTGSPVEAQSSPNTPPASLVRFAQLTSAQPASEPRPADPPAAQPGVPEATNPEAPATAPPPAASSPESAPGDTAKSAGSQENPPAASPPVQIAVSPDGRLVISSQDTAALDLLEDLLSQLVPRQPDFKVFPLKYASSLWVKLNLEDYFEEEPEDKSKRRNYYYFDYAPPQEQEKSFRLSQRKPLKFIDDVDTNTILVVGANAEQLKTIGELIRLWDTPPPTDSQSARITAVFQIRYSKAETVAETVKEVYLDLLSSNDKALQKGRDDKRPASQTTYIFGESGGGEPDRRTQVSFKGKLSIGVDAVSNTLLVSTEGQTLMENVSKMIEALDEAAKPASEVEVVTLRGDVNAEQVRKLLADMLGEKAVQAGQGGPPNQPPGGPQPGQPGWQPPGPGR